MLTVLERPILGLAGCVKTKGTQRVAAKDLYTSPLFKARRRWCETVCDGWAILSAKYHYLVQPDEVIDPYDKTLQGMSSSMRKIWSSNLAYSAAKLARSMDAQSIQIHAGRDYWANGLRRELRRQGFLVDVFMEGAQIGDLLAGYKMGVGQ